MKLLKNLFKKPNFLPLVVVLVFAVLASRTLLFQKGYFNMHDDLQMMRQLEMEKCFLDFQIPCRWVPDMGYGYGFPLFNFYPPLPYLIGEALRLIGFSFINTVKLTFALGIILSGVTMYFLAREFFPPLGGVLASVFYLWAPYHSVDVYVRGAMNESWALVWFPLIFWTSYRLISERKKEVKWLISLALAWTGLLMSHNLMVLIFLPVFGLWCTLWLWQKKNWRIIRSLAISGLIAFGLAAFFTLPALLENKFTWVKSQLTGYYDYTAHFVSLKQLLISRFWDYGPSVWVDIEDKMSFQIGHLHWILSLVVGGFLIFLIIRKKKLTAPFLACLYLFLVGWLAAFMTHLRSIFIYKAFPILGLIQFPWRFLTMIIFSFSFLIGCLVLLLPKRLGPWLVGLLAIGLVAFNWNYFLPQHGKMGALTDKEKLSGAAWDLQQTAGIYDYLPITAQTAPKSPQVVLAEFMEGEGEIIEPKQGTDWAKFKIKVTTENSRVRINLLYFPGWKVWVDGKKAEASVPDEEKWGRMWVGIPQGEHQVRAKLTNTPVRTLANGLSLVSWLGLVTFPIWRKKVRF